MPSWLVVILLGIIEGITEFLPVSSTGHLLIAEQWLGHQSDLFNVGIQSGAVLAVLVVFARRAQSLVMGLGNPEIRDYVTKLTAAFVLTGVGGVVLKKLDIELPESVTPVAIATLVGGILFIVVEAWLGRRDKNTIPEPAHGMTLPKVGWSVALAVGAAQLVAAVFPGASRSGTTILVALALGLARPAAIEFSFLLGIPTLLAAASLEVFQAVRHPPEVPVDWGMLALGFGTAAVTAFATVRWLLHFVTKHSFAVFGWYRILLGAALLLWLR